MSMFEARFLAETETPVMIPIDDAAQWFMVMTCALMLVFYMFEYLRDKITWEGPYVMFIEMLGYFFGVVLQGDSLPTIGPMEEPLLRYMSWILTCPILIKILMKLVAPKIDPQTLNKLVVSDIMMNACGIFACLYTTVGVQLALFAIGSMFWFYIIRMILKLHVEVSDKLDHLGERRFYLGFFLVTWQIFPITFLLGPPVFNVFGRSTNVLVHCFGDLVAKNIFSLLAWKMNRKWGFKSAVKQAQSKPVEDEKDEEMGGNYAAKTGMTPTASSASLPNVQGTFYNIHQQQLLEAEAAASMPGTPQSSHRRLDALTPGQRLRTLGASPLPQQRTLELAGDALTPGQRLRTLSASPLPQHRTVELAGVQPGVYGTPRLSSRSPRLSNSVLQHRAELDRQAEVQRQVEAQVAAMKQQLIQEHNQQMYNANLQQQQQMGQQWPPSPSLGSRSLLASGGLPSSGPFSAPFAPGASAQQNTFNALAGLREADSATDTRKKEKRSRSKSRKRRSRSRARAEDSEDYEGGES